MSNRILDMKNYKSFFLTADKKLEWTNKSFESDHAAIRDAKSKLLDGETVKIYSDTRTVWDSECAQETP